MLAALLLAVSTHALAQTRDTRMPWRAEVRAPRPGLPVASVEVGYPGPYVPAFNSPIAIKATASDAGFDGYIGFRFVVKDRKTLDTPVIARAVLKPHESWTFRTIATLHYWADDAPPRELIIEWRNRDAEVIALASAGDPPWIAQPDHRLPLRVIRPNESTSNATAYGSSAYAEAADQLPDAGQWYAGFSSVIVPLELWLDLRQPVRDAIFGSAVDVVFIGFARSGQSIDTATRALLPVEFTDRASTYSVPWPYGSGTVNAPVSWAAKRGAGSIGPASSPYIARTVTAMWGADERAVSQPRPSLVPLQSRVRFTGFDPITRDRRPNVWAAIALVAGVLAWLLVRTNRTVAGVVLAIAFTAMVAMSRDRIHERVTTGDHVLKASLGPGIGIEYHVRFEHGASPLAAGATDRASITGELWAPQDAEIRTTGTAPSMGAVKANGAWASDVRWTMQRKVSDASTPAQVSLWTGVSLHDFQLREMIPPADARKYVVQGDVRKLADGRMQATFALPAAASSARLFLGAFAGPVDLTWASGSAQIQPQTSGYVHECVLTPELLRAIEGSGGVFDVNVTPSVHIVRPTYILLLQIEEKS